MFKAPLSLCFLSAVTTPNLALKHCWWHLSSCKTPPERQLSHNSWNDAPPSSEPRCLPAVSEAPAARLRGVAGPGQRTAARIVLKRQDEAKPEEWIPERPASGIWKCIRGAFRWDMSNYRHRLYDIIKSVPRCKNKSPQMWSCTQSIMQASVIKNIKGHIRTMKRSVNHENNQCNYIWLS